MIKVKYPRRGFVVEEVTEGCKTEGCSAKKLIVIPFEDYGEENFNELTEGMTVNQNFHDEYNEGACPICKKAVTFNRHFIVTSDASTIKTAKEAFYYAKDVLSAPFPEGEALIATDAGWAACYARDILKTPWAEGEAAIATSVQWSFNYASCVLNAPFRLGEALIATSAEYSYNYAIYVLKAPFILGEKAIATNAYYYKEYKKLFPEPIKIIKPISNLISEEVITETFVVTPEPESNSTTMKTDELDGTALDFMVSRCSIYHEYLLENVIPLRYDDDKNDWSPSTNWKQAGVYIHNNNISICYENENQWKSYISGENTSYGSTPLVSAMRCFVKSKFGTTVDIPNWVLGKELAKA